MIKFFTDNTRFFVIILLLIIAFQWISINRYEKNRSILQKENNWNKDIAGMYKHCYGELSCIKIAEKNKEQRGY